MTLYLSTSYLNFARVFLSLKSVKALKGQTISGGDMNLAWLLKWLPSSPKYYSLPHFDALHDVPRKASMIFLFDIAILNDFKLKRKI